MFCREVAAEVGLRTTYVACRAKDKPSRIMGLIVADLRVRNNNSSLAAQSLGLAVHVFAKVQGAPDRPTKCTLHKFHHELLGETPHRFLSSAL